MSNSKLLLWSILLLHLTACSDSYHPITLPEPNAMKDGPGIVSGKDGKLYLYASKEQIDSSPDSVETQCSNSKEKK